MPDVDLVSVQPAAPPKGFTAEQMAKLEGAWGLLADGDIGRVNAQSYQLVFRRPTDPEFRAFKQVAGKEGTPQRADAQATLAERCTVGIWSRPPGEQQASSLIATTNDEQRALRDAVGALRKRRPGCLDNEVVSELFKRLLSEEAEAAGKD